VTGQGPLIAEVIKTIKQAINASNTNCPDPGGKLRVGTAHLTLKVAAVPAEAGTMAIRVPSADLAVKDSRQLTHTVDLSIVPPDNPGGDDRSSALAEAINAIKDALAIPDQFLLNGTNVSFSFAVDNDGAVLLGGSGDLGAAITHTLALTLVPASAQHPPAATAPQSA
jgi:hypothetical protein